ncbi:hypothetical protein SAMN04488058_1326 [Deinococcus reticulitermitis]|uniref:Uncharacterized protein n=1 Tax=Deinococcus reticulitermitis TaxID=856736 RepID=A0A1H7CKB8_9DEIO|nr:hypothetical protein [Deinococcus reticulitermitis]SEJ90233.1 hypothetical protein SAMN04488058_1326 [Deinococcus reticulitermitis]
MSRLAELDARMKALDAQLAALKAERKRVAQERAEVICEENGAFPVGSVISWGDKSLRYGRVLERAPWMGSLRSFEYLVVNLRRNGSEGAQDWVRAYHEPVLVAETYEEGRVYHQPAGASRAASRESAQVDAEGGLA